MCHFNTDHLCHFLFVLYNKRVRETMCAIMQKFVEAFTLYSNTRIFQQTLLLTN